jgi:uncharacterized protein YjbI with pentapeptide repeats
VSRPRRATSKAPLVPAQPDLSHEPVRQELPEDLRGFDLEGVLLERLDLAGREASNLQLVKSRMVQLDLNGSAVVGAGFRDVIAVGGSWANIRAERAILRRVHLQNLRLTGANFAEADIQDATFEDCRIDLASRMLCRRWGRCWRTRSSTTPCSRSFSRAV